MRTEAEWSEMKEPQAGAGEEENRPQSIGPGQPAHVLRRTLSAAYNAQAVVDCDSQVIVAQAVTQDCNDEQRLLPLLELARTNLGTPPEKLLTDSGYFCTEAVQNVKGVDLYITTHSSYQVRVGKPMRPRKRKPAVREEMAERLKSEDGHRIFARRKRTVECVFDQIKEDRGLRRFLLWGLDKVRPEWTLACLGHNARKLWMRDKSNHHGLAAGVSRKTGKATRMMRASC